MASRKIFYLAALAVHLFLITAISAREMFWVLGRGLTLAPDALKPFWLRAENASSAAVGQSLGLSNPVRRMAAGYLNLAGIESGYGFFAPNVSDSCKLVFELRYPDGRIEYEVPSVNSEAAGLRVATLLDKIGRPQYAPLRGVLVKMLTQSVWQDHPEVESIRAVFGSVVLPSVSEFEKGIPASSRFMFAYDFSFRDPEAAEPKQ